MSIIRFLKDNELDGVELLWNRNTEETLYCELLQHLKMGLEKQEKQYSISLRVPQTGIGKWHIGCELEDQENADSINLISMAEYENQLFGSGGVIRISEAFNTAWEMKYHACNSNQSSKFNLVIPTIEQTEQIDMQYVWNPEKKEIQRFNSSTKTEYTKLQMGGVSIWSRDMDYHNNIQLDSYFFERICSQELGK